MAARKSLADSQCRLPEDAIRVSRTDPATPITLSLYLRDRTGSTSRLQRDELSSWREKQHARDVELVRVFARDHDLEVEHVDHARRFVRLTGPADAMERAFEAELYEHDHSGGTFRAPVCELTVPSEVHDCVLAVLGLEDRSILQPRQAVGERGHLPTEFAKFYRFPGGYTGKGQTIVLFEFGGGYKQSDLEAAAGAMGIAVPEVKDVSVDGGRNALGSRFDTEVTLDIQIAMGAAPEARLLVYFSASSEQGMIDAISTAIHDAQNKADVISISWGFPEERWSKQALRALDQVLVDAGRLGVTVIAASGDGLAGGGLNNGKVNVDFPASSPHALACGGTTLTIDDDEISGEVVWNDRNRQGTGGGVSVEFSRPDYQANTNVPTSLDTGNPGRALPDVAAHGDPRGGYRICLNGRWKSVGGTSASTPLWAGLIARANQARAEQDPPLPPLGFINPHLYDEDVQLGSVTEGDNCIIIRRKKAGYEAGPGYDCCTGMGTPAHTEVFEALTQLRSHELEIGAEKEG